MYRRRWDWGWDVKGPTSVHGASGGSGSHGWDFNPGQLEETNFLSLMCELAYENQRHGL